MNNGLYSELGLKEETLNAYIKNIKAGKQIISDSWNEISKEYFPKLQNSWAGDAAKNYIDALVKYNVKIEALITTLDLLSSTLQKASDLIKHTDSELASNIYNKLN